MKAGRLPRPYLHMLQALLQADHPDSVPVAQSDQIQRLYRAWAAVRLKRGKVFPREAGVAHSVPPHCAS
jgi:hypothetical protein